MELGTMLREAPLFPFNSLIPHQPVQFGFTLFQNVHYCRHRGHNQGLGLFWEDLDYGSKESDYWKW